MAQLSRAEKEKLAVEKSAELEIRWRGRLPPDDDFQERVKELSDERLDAFIADTIGQLRFEKVWDTGVYIVVGAVALFIIIGVVGLLLFGWRQVFS